MRHPVLIAALALSALTACTPAAVPDEPSAPAASGSGTAAQAAWEARGPSAYAYQLEISCFCIHRGQYAIEVRDDRILSARNAATGAPPTENQLSWLLTVDRLLEAIRQASSIGTPVRATYDPSLGYPVEAEIGTLADDSGTLYRITNLRAL